MTPVDLAAFQRLRIGPDGQRLVADGQLGPKTQWALDLEQLPSWRQQIVLGALHWVGFHETGENGGTEVTAWLGACGVQPGNPWCAAFVSAILRGAGIACAEASVSHLARKFPESDPPLPGDVSYWIRDDETGHCGIVTGVQPDRVSTCEGNSADGVRTGIRPMHGLSFCRPNGHGIPGVWDKLPALGAVTQ